MIHWNSTRSFLPPSAEMMAMFAFFNGPAYDADIPALRKELPQLQSFERYLRRTDWANATSGH